MFSSVARLPQPYGYTVIPGRVGRCEWATRMTLAFFMLLDRFWLVCPVESTSCCTCDGRKIQGTQENDCWKSFASNLCSGHCMSYKTHVTVIAHTSCPLVRVTNAPTVLDASLETPAAYCFRCFAALTASAWHSGI